ncbi:hypothetical protein MJ584_04810 [Klebsiella pneumoniae]|nr:hypothetical protein MJ584_04810 [Klebsiella pneumoniae]
MVLRIEVNVLHATTITAASRQAPAAAEALFLNKKKKKARGENMVTRFQILRKENGKYSAKKGDNRNRSIFHEHNEPLAQGKQNKILLYLIYVI